MAQAGLGRFFGVEIQIERTQVGPECAGLGVERKCCAIAGLGLGMALLQCQQGAQIQMQGGILGRQLQRAAVVAFGLRAVTGLFQHKGEIAPGLGKPGIQSQSLAECQFGLWPGAGLQMLLAGVKQRQRVSGCAELVHAAWPLVCGFRPRGAGQGTR